VTLHRKPLTVARETARANLCQVGSGEHLLLLLSMESTPTQLGAKSRGKFKRDTLQDLFPTTNNNSNSSKDSPTKESSSTSKDSGRKLDYETTIHTFPREDRAKPACKCGELLTNNFWCVRCSAFCVNTGLGSKTSSKGLKSEDKK
jgi:hypothetical protein